MLLEFTQDSTLLQYYIIMSAIVVCKCTKTVKLLYISHAMWYFTLGTTYKCPCLLSVGIRALAKHSAM